MLATDYPDDHPESVAGRQFHGQNPWPEDLPGFREAVSGYMATVEKLGLSLLPEWARPLDLPANLFAP